MATSVGETFVLSSGPADGTPVLLLPGSGSVAASWGPELAELGRSHRVHAIDLPGESGLPGRRTRAHPVLHQRHRSPQACALLLAAGLGALGDRGRRQALNYLLGPRRPAWTSAFHQDLGALALLTFKYFRPRTDSIPTFTDDELRSLPTALTFVERLLLFGVGSMSTRQTSGVLFMSGC